MKKVKWISIACLFIAVLGFWYFRTLSFEKYLTEVKDVSVLNRVLEFTDGKLETTHEMYTELSENQRNQIVELLKESSYRRKIDTFFWDGSIQEAEYLIEIYVYDDDYSLTSITLTEKDEVFLEAHKYKMDNSEQVVHDVLEILN